MKDSAPRGCAAAYKALPGGTYRCEREEAGGLALLSKALFSEAVPSEALVPENFPAEAVSSSAPTGSPFPRANLASSLSREGHIISMRMLLSQATQRRKR